MTSPTLQQHPDYHEGFFDAVDGEPLLEADASAEYIAGWRAYWQIRELLGAPDFPERLEVALLPAERPQRTLH